MRETMVKEWMTSQPVTAGPEMSLPDALLLMRERAIRRLPIVEKGKLIGIVTHGDLRGAQPSQATSLSIFELHYLVGRICLREIMTPHPITVTPVTSIREAADIMLQRKISGLPVMDNNQLVGIITESDIFRMVVKTWRREEQAAPQPA